MLAGEFRYVWKLLNSIYNVSDGLEEVQNVSLDEKINARRAASKHFLTKTCRNRGEVINALDRMNIAWGDVRQASDVQKLASVEARTSIAEVDDRAGGKRLIPSSPYKYKHLESKVRAGAPHLGEHNEEVLKQWLGWSTEQISTVQSAFVNTTRE